METKTRYCPICGKEIKIGDGHHIKKCIDNYVSNLDEDKIAEIKRLYVDDGYSMVDMSKYFSFKYNLTTKIMKRLGLEKRTISEATRQKKCREKYKETCLKNFGYEHNFLKNCPSRKQWENRLFEEEGITNVFQRETVKEKIKQTMLERYGEEGILENRRKGNFIEYYIEKYGEEEGKRHYEYINKRKALSNTKEYFIEKYGEEKWIEHLKKINVGYKHNCGLNDKCEEILKKNNIEYEREFSLYSKEHYYHYDFKIGNLIIELNGTYWHCSPKIYKPNDMVKFPNNKFIKACDKWEYDKKKNDFAISNGYECVVIWEDEFSEKLVLEIINKQNGKN